MVPVTRTSRLTRGDSTGAGTEAARAEGGRGREHEAKSSNPAANASLHNNGLISQIRRPNSEKVQGNFGQKLLNLWHIVRGPPPQFGRKASETTKLSPRFVLYSTQIHRRMDRRAVPFGERGISRTCAGLRDLLGSVERWTLVLPTASRKRYTIAAPISKGFSRAARRPCAPSD